MPNTGIVYAIYDKTTNEQYIGSTKLRLYQRIKLHESNYKTYQQTGRGWSSSFHIIKNKNYDHREIETIQYNDKTELLELERHYTNTLPNVVNKIKRQGTCMIDISKCPRDPNDTRSYQQYFRDTFREQMKQYHKQYQLNNKELIKTKNNIICDCACGLKYRKGYKSKHLKTNIHNKLMYINDHNVQNSQN